eukprot:scaffold12678_cov167-Skeletonema_dohrnii-CCMP3373.AAC.1
MRTQNLAAPHGPKSVAFREFIAAAPYLNPSSRQVPMSSDITDRNDSLKYKDIDLISPSRNKCFI